MRILNSFVPWENWHLSPYLHLPVSVNGLHNSVLYRVRHPCECVPDTDRVGGIVVVVVEILIGGCCTMSVIGTRGDERDEVEDSDDE